jgi:4-methylaminobutanoate oxidase (formaldehyde-forming)
VQFLLSDPEPLLYHNEPIYRDGERVGITTSAMYGHTLGGTVALGYVAHAQGVSDAFVTGGRYMIDAGGVRYPASVSVTPLYDPGNTRIRV